MIEIHTHFLGSLLSKTSWILCFQEGFPDKFQGRVVDMIALERGTICIEFGVSGICVSLLTFHVPFRHNQGYIHILNNNNYLLKRNIT